MKKILFLACVLFSAAIFGQTKTNIITGTPNTITDFKDGLRGDSLLGPPVGRGAPSINMLHYMSAKRGSNIYIDTLNKILYFYNPSDNTWSTTSGGGGSGIHAVYSGYGLLNVNDSTLRVDTSAISTKANVVSLLQGKQDQLNGTGFVKASGTTISYDNSTYVPTSRTLSTTVPLTGGGDLSTNRIFGIGGLTTYGTSGQLIASTGSGWQYVNPGSDTLVIVSSDTLYVNKKLRIPVKDTASYANHKAGQITYAPLDKHYYGDNGTYWSVFDAVTGMVTQGSNITITGTGTLADPYVINATGSLSPALTNTHIFVGNGSNVATDVAASGDLSLANTGAFTITGLRTKALPSLSAGFLTYTGSAWAFDNSTYITSASLLQTASGDVTGTVSGTNLPLTLATVNSNIGTFNNITINAKGLATAGSNVAYLTANQAITVTATGDATGVSSSSGTAPSLPLTLATVNSNVGTFGDATHVGAFTVSGKGLITAASSVAITGFASSTLSNTHLLVGNVSNVATDVAASGDLTLANNGAFTLATVNSNIGTFNNVTVNGKGLVTAASNVGYLTAAITSLNGLTDATQTFAVGTSGSDFNISSAAAVHTFNIPDASNSSSVRGLVTGATQSFIGTKSFVTGIVLNATSNVFRTTNAGANINSVPLLIDMSGSASVAGALSVGFDATTGLQNFNAANGTRRITRAQIGITNLVNTAGSESGDFIINTQSGGTAASEKFRISSGGLWSLSTVAGTANQIPVVNSGGTAMTWVTNTGLPYWPLTGTGTGTGATNITYNTANQLTLDGTFTTTANNQWAFNHNPTVTARGTTSDVFIGMKLSPTLIYGANSQNGIALDIAPTYTPGAFSATLATALRAAGNIDPSSNNLYSLGRTSFFWNNISATTWNGLNLNISSGTVLTFKEGGSNSAAKLFSGGGGNSNFNTVGLQVGSTGKLTSTSNGPAIEGLGNIKAWGAMIISSLTTPTISSVVPQGTTGAATWTYKVVAVQDDGTTTDASAAVSTTTGNATLTAGNFNLISWAEITGAKKYYVYRTVSGGTPLSLGKVATVTTGFGYSDIGGAGDATTAPTTNKTGNLAVGATTALGVADFTSTTQGIVLPRMTKAQRDAIVTPVAGMAVYQTDNTPGLRVYNGTNWMRYTETID